MNNKLLFVIFPVITSILLFSATLGFDFAWLDYTEILSGKLIISDFSEWITMLFLDDSNHNVYHRPFYNLMHTLDYSLYGNSPKGYHLSNLLLHTLNAGLIYFVFQSVVKRTFLSVAMALIWVALPIHAPVAGLIHAKGDLLSTTFILSSFLLIQKGRRWSLILGALSLLSALLTKEVALAAIPLLWIWNKEKGASRPVLWSIAIPTLLYLVFRVSTGVAEGGEGFSFDLHRIITFPLVYGSYYFETLTGITLGISDTVMMWKSRETMDLLVHIVLFLAAVGIQFFFWKKAPNTRPFILWFNIFLLPVSQIIPIPHFRADRFLYLASAGWLGAWALGLDSLIKEKRIIWGLAGLLFMYFSWRTYHELPYYQNTKTLFERTVDQNPKNREAHAYLGLLAMEEGDDAKAVFHYTRALNGNPSIYSFVDRNPVKANLATSKMRLQQYDEAKRLYESLYEDMGKPVEMDLNMGLCYKALRMPQKAYDHLIRYQRKYPESIQVMEKLAEVYVDLGKKQKAIDELNRILKKEPNHPNREYIIIAIQQLQNS